MTYEEWVKVMLSFDHTSCGLGYDSSIKLVSKKKYDRRILHPKNTWRNRALGRDHVLRVLVGEDN